MICILGELGSEIGLSVDLLTIEFSFLCVVYSETFLVDVITDIFPIWGTLFFTTEISESPGSSMRMLRSGFNYLSGSSNGDYSVLVRV